MSLVDRDLFYGNVKYGKMIIHRISWKVLKILAKKLVIRVVLMSTEDLWVEEVNVIIWPLAQNSLSMTISKATGPIVTKFHVEDPGAEGTKIC